MRLSDRHDVMSPDQRQAELATIFATCILRMHLRLMALMTVQILCSLCPRRLTISETKRTGETNDFEYRNATSAPGT